MWFSLLFLAGLLIYAIVFIIKVMRRNSVSQLRHETTDFIVKMKEEKNDNYI